MSYRVKDLIKTYGGRTVLNLEDISLEGGKVHGIIGPNGAGKTTFLEVLAFLLPPTSGEVWFGEERVDFSGLKLIRLRQRVVMVQQKPILFTTTVYNNVEFPLKIRGRPGPERERTVNELLDLVGMENFRDAKAHRLSGGETQRVAIAQALACSPEVILMDEPTASVDVENQINIERIIREINRKKGISVIFTTHDMIQASRMADEIVFMFEGKAADSIHENIFSGRIETDPGGDKYCLIREGLRVGLRTGRTGQVRMAINPGRVVINRDGGEISNENNFKGRLMQLTYEKGRVRAVIDIGVPLSVLIPEEAVNDLNLVMGEMVWLSIPQGSIEVF